MKVNSVLIILLFSILIKISLCAKHTKEEWKSRSIYQIITDRFATNDTTITKCNDLTKYCGGNFQGIIQQLDYIKGMGFDAIWISPPFKNKEDRYHGYHNIDIYTVNEHFGSADDLKLLIEECHKKDIWVILDAVPNHMADDEDVSNYQPFDSPQYYHNLKDEKCSDPVEQYYIENCDPWGLKDLKQEDSFVSNELRRWLKYTINEYGFDGVRYADVANVPKWFWGNFTNAAEKTYTLGIVSSNNDTYISDYQNYMDGVGEYTLYHVMHECFCSGSMKVLDKYIQNNHTKYLSPQYNGIWFSNHDNERFLYDCKAENNKEDKLLNGIIFTLFFEGIPIFYYGDEQYCKEEGEGDKKREVLFWKYNTTTKIYKYLKIANDVRKEKEIYEKDFIRRYADDNFYVFTRGDVLIAVGNGNTGKITLKRHGFKRGDKLCNRLQNDDCITVENNLELNIDMTVEPKIYVRMKSLVEELRDVDREDGAKYLNLFSLLFILLLW